MHKFYPFFYPCSVTLTVVWADSSEKSVSLSFYPFLIIEVPPSTVKIQAVSVAVQVCVEGLPVWVRSQTGLKRLVPTAGDVCLVEVNLSRLTTSFESGIIQVSACSDAAVK